MVRINLKIISIQVLITFSYKSYFDLSMYSSNLIFESFLLLLNQDSFQVLPY